jgi:hypothetical protein
MSRGTDFGCCNKVGVIMNQSLFTNALPRAVGLLLFSTSFIVASARAGLTVDIHLYHDNNGYYFYPFLSTNTIPPNFPVGDYLIASPEIPASGSRLVFRATATSFNECINNDCGGATYYNSFDSLLNGITNGLWSIWVTNGSTTQFQFQVTATGFTSNSFGAYASITFPTNNQLNVPNLPTFTWTGPANWAGTLNVQDNFVDTNGNYNYVDSSSLTPNAISWTPSVSLPNGTNNFSVNYTSNLTATVIASTPTNNAGQAISGWASSSTMETSPNILFVAGQTANPFDIYLVARYDFEITNSPGTDSSGNGNDANCGSGTGSTTNNDTFSTNAAVGSYARDYFGNNAICFYPNGADCFNNISNALYGSFTLSAWVNTTNSVNSDFANAYFGSPIWFDYNSNTNSAILSITGSKAAFTIGNPDGTDTVLHSTTSVNDGRYHFIAVTRNQTNGLMSLYVDGRLEATGTSTSDSVIATATMYIAGGDAGFYSGLLDDLRIYSEELTASDVATLSGNPINDFNAALNTTNLTWTTSGDTSWYVETTNTYNSDPAAAQSGSVINSQTSILSTTVTGPGTLTFYWSSIANDPNQSFDYVFDIDGSYANDIFGDNSWLQAGPFTIPAGAHTLTWTVSANGDTDPTQAGFLDQVSFVVNNTPVITLNPFDQTNYPGYNVALLAAANTNTAVTWQWFKVGDASPIPNATNALFIPTNSGTPTVAGSYYGVASNIEGSVNTTTAAVSFVSAPLPPDWAIAYKSQLFNNASDITTNYNIACLLDPTGTNIYTVGSFTGTNYFGPDVLITADGVFESSFLKQTTAGTAIWARSITNNGNGSSFTECVAAAPGGGIYAAGDFFGTNWLGTNKLADVAGGSVYLVRFDAAGNALWVQTLTGTNGNFTGYHDLTSDSSGNVTLSALISGGTSIGTSNVFATGQQGVLVQFDASGNLRWLQMPSGWPSYLVYNGGCIYGSMGGSPTNYIGGLTNLTDRRQILFSLNATNGQDNWMRGMAAAQSTPGNPFGFVDDGALVAVSGTNIFVAGNAWGSNASFGPFTVTFSTSKGQYLARYDTNGNPQLATSFGSEFTWPFSIKADASGNIYIGSDFDNYSIFGNDIIAAPFYDTVQSLGSSSPGARIPGQSCVAKFDRNGNPLWARLAQSQSSYLNSRDIALASDGVWSCGLFNQQSVFGSITINGGVTCIGSPTCTLQYHASGYLAKILEPASIPLPVALVNPQYSGVNFQFQFQSQSGFNHYILYRTNLVSGLNWQTYSNIAGDGTLKTIPIPLLIFNPANQGFIRVLTQ